MFPNVYNFQGDFPDTNLSAPRFCATTTSLSGTHCTQLQQFNKVTCYFFKDACKDLPNPNTGTSQTKIMGSSAKVMIQENKLLVFRGKLSCVDSTKRSNGIFKRCATWNGDMIYQIWVFPKKQGYSPKSCILIRFCSKKIIHFGGGVPPIFGNIHIIRGSGGSLLKSGGSLLVPKIPTKCGPKLPSVGKLRPDFLQQKRRMVGIDQSILLVGGFSPTHLKNMLVKMGNFPLLSRGENAQKIFETSTQIRVYQNVLLQNVQQLIKGAQAQQLLLHFSRT